MENELEKRAKRVSVSLIDEIFLIGFTTVALGIIFGIEGRKQYLEFFKLPRQQQEQYREEVREELYEKLHIPDGPYFPFGPEY